MSAGDDSRGDQEVIRRDPVGSFGGPARGDEIGAVVAFLCSAEASRVSGVDWSMDGSFSSFRPDQGRSSCDQFERLAVQDGSGITTVVAKLKK